jgi:hypothetical protein
MRARRLQLLIAASITLAVLGGCGDGGGSGDGGEGGKGDPAPTTVASESAVPEEGSILSEEMLVKVCQTAETPATDEPENAAPDNPYAAAVQALARSLGQMCRDREKT